MEPIITSTVAPLIEKLFADPEQLEFDDLMHLFHTRSIVCGKTQIEICRAELNGYELIGVSEQMIGGRDWIKYHIWKPHSHINQVILTDRRTGHTYVITDINNTLAS